MIQTSEESQVRYLLEQWAERTRLGQLDDVLANHSPGVVIYDVLPPMKYESAQEYRASWGDWQPDTTGEGQFGFDDLAIVADERLAYANGFIRCG